MEIKLSGFLPYSGRSFDLQFNLRHRRLVLRQDNAVKVQVGTCPFQILHLEAFHLDFLDKFLFVGIKRVKSVDAVMVGLMGCGIIQDKQRLESSQCRLCGCAFHFLRLVHNDDRPVRRYHINRLPAAEIIPFRIYDAAFLVLGALLQ